MVHPLLPLAEEFEEVPDLRCPTCKSGHLIRQEPFVLRGDAASEQVKRVRPDVFEPDMIDGVFTGFLTCGRPTCGEHVAVAGGWRVGHPATYEEEEYPDSFRLSYAQPALILVDCPAGTPESVVQACRAAARIVWVDPAGAAGRLRLAVEELLTAQKVSQARITRKPGKPAKRVRRTTHERIVEFGTRKGKEQAGMVLEAVKWIGNAGSHENALGLEDALEGAEMLGLALQLLYDPSHPNLMRRVEAVIKRRGPAPRRTRRRTTVP
ncbi:DUF4145 domain-containing protein [Micromonospora sp. ANENR4]|uniref:DUF4145 domain-containing protein n=1 Tax=Micromonospora sp. ANENR4 TaxID=2783662 RepID=UPI00189061C2|nr:DUF4145 domain-containing protein [Micromonospora sp. ANENR4]MBF5033049.1 DUF4145 domain-containing protein [Micromonospora sp. ANENR4]